ncbi:MAG: glycosyltransferase [Cytophagaceae bacterium]
MIKNKPQGISILIPIYNTDARPLMKSLSVEVGKVFGRIPTEIVCLDDGSIDRIKQINEEIAQYDYVKYRELPDNIGRSAIRNLLAEEATYNTLIFLDGDSGVPPGFLERYLHHFKDPVVVGGRTYPVTSPGPEYTLHWKIGISREFFSPENRQKKPYKSFMLNNLMIKSCVYNDIKLDEKIKGYGHEDTKFGYQLKEKKIPITYTHNPVFHMGLDSNQDFLRKTKEGVGNLYLIAKNGYGLETTLYQTFLRLKRLRMLNAFLASYKLMEKKIEDNLLSPSPSLTFFDMYKLNILIRIYKEDLKK